MRAAAVNLVPVLRTYMKQIIPPVLATLIAALLIAGFNRAFSGHLVQPRMAALHSNEETRPTEAKTREIPALEIVSASEPTPAERIFAKDNDREAAKDQPTLKVAVAAPSTTPATAPAPLAALPISAPPSPRTAQRPTEPTRAATAPLAPTPVPVVVAAPVQPVAPPVAIQQPFPQEPPTVILGRPVPTPVERPRAQPQMPPPQQQATQQEPAQPAQPRAFERFVDSMKPSSILDRMREFGDRIEAAGNEILPSIRQ